MTEPQDSSHTARAGNSHREGTMADPRSSLPAEEPDPMGAKFELVRDDLGRFSFRLLDGDRVLLGGLPNAGKIAVQSDVRHARQAIAKGDAFVAHTADDGQHFAVLKDKNGEVLARTVKLANASEVATLIDRIVAIAPNAGLMDHSGTPHRLHA